MQGVKLRVCMLMCFCSGELTKYPPDCEPFFPWKARRTAPRQSDAPIICVWLECRHDMQKVHEAKKFNLFRFHEQFFSSGLDAVCMLVLWFQSISIVCWGQQHSHYTLCLTSLEASCSISSKALRHWKVLFTNICTVDGNLHFLIRKVLNFWCCFRC